MRNLIERAGRARAIMVLFFAALACTLSTGGEPASAAPEGLRRTVVILHTNDTHAAYRPTPASWRDDRPLMGGVLALDAAVRAERERWRRVLLVDAGDILTGSPLSEIESAGAKGGALFELMGRIGYDAITLGNHDFDQGAANLEALIAMAPFSVLSANLEHPDGRPYAPAPGRVFDLDGVRVGIVGLITEELEHLLPVRILESVRVRPAAEAARAWIASQDPRPDVLVALTHLGIEADEALARAVPELDLIVGGHSHTRLTEARVVGSTRIVQAGSRMKNLGRVRLEVEDGRVVSADAGLIELFAAGVRERPELAAEVHAFEQRIDAVYGEVLGELVRPWRRKGNSSNVGIWLAEALADGTGSDFGLMNNGGIRADLPAGPITRLDVYRVLPFHNYVTTFRLRGDQLLALLQEQARRTAARDRGRLQIGYLTARWARRGDDIVLVEATCRGQAIDPDRVYQGASADFVVVSQADHYLGCEPTDVHVLEPTLAEFVEARIRELGRIDARADDRLDEVQAAP